MSNYLRGMAGVRGATPGGGGGGFQGDDFESQPAGIGVPSGWESIWEPESSVEIIQDVANSSKFMRVNSPARGQQIGIVLTGISFENGEILAKIKMNSVDWDGLLFRATGDATSYTGYFCTLDKNFSISRYVNKGFGRLADGITTVSTGIYYLMRVNFSGTTFKSKIWEPDTSEPASWNYQTTDSSISGPGQVGIFSYDSESIDVEFFSYSTDPLVAAPLPV